jgi:HUS1 checkpoint protein
MTISHDINVRVLGPRRQGELNEPLCPPPDVSGPFARVAESMLPTWPASDSRQQIHLVLPNLTDLRNLVSRLGHMADDVEISANQVSREQSRNISHFMVEFYITIPLLMPSCRKEPWSSR